jgi:hypothetical protein
MNPTVFFKSARQALTKLTEPMCGRAQSLSVVSCRRNMCELVRTYMDTLEAIERARPACAQEMLRSYLSTNWLKHELSDS